MGNPFVWDAPATPGSTTGFEQFAAIVAGALQSRRTVAISGPPGSGKSTLLESVGLEIPGTWRLRRVDLKRGFSRPAVEWALGLAAVSDGGDTRAVVLALDDFDRVDDDTAAAVQGWITSPDRAVAGVVFTGAVTSALRSLTARFGSEVLPLPPVGRAELSALLIGEFAAADRPADREAVSHLLNHSRSHPRATIRLAHLCWELTPPGEPVTLHTVREALDQLTTAPGPADFVAWLDALITSGDAGLNEARALQLLADNRGEKLTSRKTAAEYGFSSHSRVPESLERLRRRGIVERRYTGWTIPDPLLAEWLRRTSPFAAVEVVAA